MSHEFLILFKSNPVLEISHMAPISPKIIPIRFEIFHFDLKTNVAITKVKRGTSEFKIPINELSSVVWALVNKNAGIPFPNMATTIIGGQYFIWVVRILFHANGIRTKNAIDNRKMATSIKV
jgi:hypothetical protein